MTTSDSPRPKPGPPKAKAPVAEEKKVISSAPAAPKERPKYVQKPHLTERPFKNHEGLLAIRKSLESANRSQSRAKKETK